MHVPFLAPLYSILLQMTARLFLTLTSCSMAIANEYIGEVPPVLVLSEAWTSMNFFPDESASNHRPATPEHDILQYLPMSIFPVIVALLPLGAHVVTHVQHMLYSLLLIQIFADPAEISQFDSAFRAESVGFYRGDTPYSQKSGSFTMIASRPLLKWCYRECGLYSVLPWIDND